MLIANTDLEAKQLIDLYDADPARVEVVHPGVDLDVFRPVAEAAARAALGLPADADVLLFAGRIQPLKAPDVLLRAVAALLEREPGPRSRTRGPDRRRPVRLRPRQPAGARRPRRRARPRRRGPVRAAGLAGRARPLVRRRDRWSPCRPTTSRSGWSPSRPQATGTPVVAAAVGGLTTVVRDGHSGLLVDGHDARRLGRRAAAGSLDDDDAARAAGGRRARAGPAVLLGRHRRARPSRSTSGPALARSRRPCDRPGGQASAPTSTANELEYDEPQPGQFSFSLPGEKKLQTAVRLDVGTARPRRARVRLPPARREPRAGLPVAARAQPEDVRRRVRRRPARRHLPRRAAAAVGARRRRRARPAARLGADHRRRVVQHDPRARLRLLDPQGVGVAHAARRVDRRTSRRSAAGSRSTRAQEAARTSTKPTSAGSACTTRIRRLTVTAPYAPATMTQARKNSFTSSRSATSPQTRPAARNPL